MSMGGRSWLKNLYSRPWSEVLNHVGFLNLLCPLLPVACQGLSAIYKEAAGGFCMWLATLATLKWGILSSILQGGSDFPSSTGDLGLGKEVSAAPGLLTLFGHIVPLNGSTDHINSQSLKPVITP